MILFQMRVHSLRLLPALLLSWLCGLVPAQVSAADVKIEEGLVYGRAGDVELKLDLASPPGEGPFPALVFIHGGGWMGGSRQDFRGAIVDAANQGYVAVSISYRLMKFDETKKETGQADPIFPAQVHDAKAAVRWVRANAAKYRINPDKIGATGASAGGHLSLMLGLTGPADKLEGESGSPDQSSAVQAVVNIFGPTEMVSGYKTSSVSWILRLFMGGTPEEQPERYKLASPVTYVDKDDPPVLTLHGDQDELVPVAQAKLLDEKLTAAGGRHTLVIFPGQGHSFDVLHIAKARAEMYKFFDEQLKK
ncbi:MAG: alpha/beta hydrolase [Pirellulales bacterium]|nr:alpha/beta hydrolase [Pirellulales bacterium]